jgi:hypothetical protein
VLLVDDGRVTAGTHDELVLASARYRELVGVWGSARVPA